MLIQVPGLGRSVDSIIEEACASLGIERWGGPSSDGWSTYSDFLRCPYRYYLKHVRGVGPVVVGDTAPAKDIGSCVHLLLAAHYARLLPDARYPGWRRNVPAPHDLLEAMVASGLPLQLKVEVDRLYDGYVEFWAPDGFAPVAVEMPVGVPGMHTSRYDLVAFVEDGLHDGLWIVEHKTASGRADLDDFRFDGEILGEVLSWGMCGLHDYFGERLSGVCVNALVKTDPLPRFQRLWLSFPQSLIDQYADDRGYWNQRILDCEKQGRWPKALLGCRGRYQRCRFWEHCRTQDESQLVQLGGVAC